MLEAFLLLFCFACTAFMVFALGPDFEKHKSDVLPTKKLMLTLMFVISLLFTLFALRTVIQRWKKAVSVTELVIT